jgi:hypothetical protein
MATALEQEIGHGNSGLTPWSALGGVEENVPDLIGLNAVRTYNKMRQDAQIASLLLAFTLPIRRYRRVITPNGARDEVVEWVAKNMSLPIAGQEEAPTGLGGAAKGDRRHAYGAHARVDLGDQRRSRCWTREVGDLLLAGSGRRVADWDAGTLRSPLMASTRSTSISHSTGKALSRTWAGAKVKVKVVTSYDRASPSRPSFRSGKR